MRSERNSPCKVNLLLNILGRRADGFHELETVMHPVAVFDTLSFDHAQSPGVDLTCSHPELPTGPANLVHRAATAFLHAASISNGVRIHLEKRIPLAAGLGGGSSNAANTLLGLNELFENPLNADRLGEIAAALGSDVPFFLQAGPALAVGRGERISPLPLFPALRGASILLIHPGFGISTPWAYQQLAHFPEVLHGEPGRAQRLISLLQSRDVAAAAPEFYNSLEAPALKKYPLLQIYQEFLRGNGAAVALMSGSGSTTFAITRSHPAAEELAEKFRAKFSGHSWMTAARLGD
jgi:4-diphosphocytidyl-2-C-methyl-D-erythritol kinase